MPQPLLATGINGLVGSKFRDDFAAKYAVESLDVSDPVRPVDITNLSQVTEIFAQSEAKFVLHLAAYTDVTKAWEQRDDKNGLAYQVNVVGTENIVKACQETGKHLIHISTAFVFDGKKDGLYTEADATNPIEWYGQTKAWAEEVVQASTAPWTILRIDFPFRSDSFPKPDIVRKTIAALDKGYPLFANHYFGPTYIDDFAKVIDWVITSQTAGLLHASSGEKWSDYELGQALNDTLQLNKVVKKGDLDEYLKTLDRPYQRNTAMNCDTLQALLPFKLKTVREAIGEVAL